jgi:hypothetical protein
MVEAEEVGIEGPLLAEGGLFPRLDRKLLLKRFVRVLDDRRIDLSVVDTVFPLNAQAVAAF